MGIGWNDIPKEYKPSWRTWKVEGTSYEPIQKRLAKIGLKDPWLRNEVWAEYAIRSRPPVTLYTLAKRGWLSGLIVAGVIIFMETKLVD
ncbi:NADH dehydrogenase [ubiquinone] 1 beta subcomplex subunit 3-like [Styela clava]|uniref:NADH dehydrogenase [ubiquinone] 1 beta subcomplex subunit 3-like n=1 Tax=Styela clava TaxID=7725 RepID=UPI00193AB87D|nr:NADH dehydrogenase [ubiquinone] 1 beta subcomplex subunit 3-like [Styela clava]